MYCNNNNSIATIYSSEMRKPAVIWLRHYFKKVVVYQFVVKSQRDIDVSTKCLFFTALLF